MACYQAAATLPSSERFGLAPQIRRAATSIPANIAEGHGRYHTREYIQHVGIAYASLMERETHIQISERLALISNERTVELLERADEIGKMLSGLKRKLQQNHPKP